MKFESAVNNNPNPNPNLTNLKIILKIDFNLNKLNLKYEKKNLVKIVKQNYSLIVFCFLIPSSSSTRLISEFLLPVKSISSSIRLTNPLTLLGKGADVIYIIFFFGLLFFLDSFFEEILIIHY